VGELDQRLRYQFPLAERIEKAEKILSAACTSAGLKEEALRAGGRRREMSRMRKVLAQRFVNELGLSQAEAGRLLGVSTPAIAWSLRR
jgi:hypothetical protein